MNAKRAQHFVKTTAVLLILPGIMFLPGFPSPAHARQTPLPSIGLFIPVPQPVIAKDKRLKDEEKRAKRDPSI